MAVRHNTYRRIVRRCQEEVRATLRIAEVTSIREAWCTFLGKALIQVMNRGKIKENKIIQMCLAKKHMAMRKYVDKKFASFAPKEDYYQKRFEAKNVNPEKIWMCWWQGLDNAPEITRKCIESVRKNAGDLEVVIVTEKNYRDYVQFPEWIEKKHKQGTISRTHYSDLLRVFLLAEYGGIWLDATIFCAEPEISTYANMPLWTIKRPEYGHLSVAAGRFVTGAIGCDKTHRWIFQTIRDFLVQYWKESDLLIDYLIFDYLIDLAMRRDERIAKCFASIEKNNPHGDELLKVLGERYDADSWRKMKSETSLFILSWKRSFSTQKDGEDTYFAKLIEGQLK